MLLDYKFYSFVLEQDVIVEATIDYKEPDYNDTCSNLDFYGGYDILSLDLYHEDGEEINIKGSYKNQILDNEVREHLKQQIRLLEIEDSRFDNTEVDREFERHWIGED